MDVTAPVRSEFPSAEVVLSMLQLLLVLLQLFGHGGEHDVDSWVHHEGVELGALRCLRLLQIMQLRLGEEEEEESDYFQNKVSDGNTRKRVRCIYWTQYKGGEKNGCKKVYIFTIIFILIRAFCGKRGDKMVNHEQKKMKVRDECTIIS